MSGKPLAMVTGASSGIGWAFATRLAEEGYAVCAVARREDRLEQLVGHLPGAGHSYLAADLANDEDLAAVGAELSTGAYQLLVNNAGLSVMEPFGEAPLAAEQNLLNVNINAVVALAHAFLAHGAEGDALVNVGSVVSYLPTPAMAAYSGSKAFITTFSECLWSQQRERGVYVMALCPGMTETEFISAATEGESDFSSLPDAMVQSPEEVVSEALQALDRRRDAVVVTGRSNRLLSQLPRLMSRSRLIRLMSKMGDPEDRL
ncbi:SDR family NAD(P)-dependent oxidoreductase [Halioglobus maricola]|uniref:SDR family NAD(P)-dependent oxidoreductase n=1 Tax=Halioglobus maricola TaxID=2601894 RepID=A0A5P9NN51_9GAMM|nr:SDR family NAD(P)-dependent oxidoreductase [Halioglobus maricola]QFU77241.1 SDR family NAD(P)-dependent oxidoreductase [Halioglobus maricola]